MGSIGKVESDLREKAVGSLLGVLRDVLPDGLIRRLCAEELAGKRERVLTPIAMLWYWVESGLRREQSLASVWAGFWSVVALAYPSVAKWRPEETGVLARARLRVPEGMFQKLIAEVVRLAANAAGKMGWWKGYRVAVLDGSTVSMPDQAALASAFGKPRNQHGAGPYPVLRCVNLVEAGTGMLLAMAWDHHRTSEQELTERLRGCWTAHDLVLGDRNFSGWRLLAQLLVQGVAFVMRKETHLDISKYPREAIGTDEWVVELPKPQRFQQSEPHLPERIRVRVIRRRLGSEGEKRELWLVTSLLDPNDYPADELVALYRARWQVERHFQELKNTLHLGVLRSTTLKGVRLEILAHQLAYNLVRLMVLRAAKQEGVDLQRISFIHAVRTILEISRATRGASAGELGAAREVLLRMIAAGVNRLRPGRHEPRAVRRGQKPFPRLRQSRAVWRKQQGVA